MPSLAKLNFDFLRITVFIWFRVFDYTDFFVSEWASVLSRSLFYFL